jgi:omega-6 fatty acid desaturase (delta-12 desaturase)
LKNLPFDIYKYVSVSNWRSLAEVTLTLGLVTAGVITLYVAVYNNYWPLFIIIFPLGFLFTRLFILMHDLTHGSLFKPKKYNNWMGVFIGIILCTPFYYWKKAHSIHHVSGGNADRRPWKGDIELLCVKEYREKTKWKQFIYQLYRNSFVMFFLGSLYVFMIEQRFFKSRKGFGKRERQSVILTNIGILTLYGSLIIFGGIKPYLIAILLPQWIGGVIGVYLFYVQHNFKNRYFVSSEEWNLNDSALKGSTFYVLPQPLKWLTGNIGYHHIHTLIPRIPFYNLPKCHQENKYFQTAPQFGLKDMNALISLKLYDDYKGHMITWREYKANYQSGEKRI